jgi:fimbrial chaperone protein
MLSQRNYLVNFLLSLGALLLSATVYAQQVSISPLRVTFKGDQQSEILTLRNVSNAPFTVQPKVMKWSQRDGKDVFEPTREVLVAPPIVEVPAGETQVIRLSLRRAPDSKEELSYRVFVQQVAAPQRNNSSMLSFSWNLSLPIFVAPLNDVSTPNLEWVGQINGKNLELAVTNPGVQHIQVKSIKVESAVASTSSAQMIYVLGGQTDKLTVTAPAGTSDKVTIVANTDAGEIRREVAIR